MFTVLSNLETLTHLLTMDFPTMVIPKTSQFWSEDFKGMHGSWVWTKLCLRFNLFENFFSFHKWHQAKDVQIHFVIR